MSKEKQIEEMYEDIYGAITNNSVVDITHGGFIGIDTDGLTKELYDDGYRKQEWISVSERLPDGNGRFLTVDKKGDMMVCYWEKRFGWFASVCNKNAITHWMPLPEPPKGE